MHSRAIALTAGYFDSVFAKTTHGLVRGPCRYELAAVVDAQQSGQDAGSILDGERRGIPVLGSVPDALATLTPPPTHCVIGVATIGGVLPRTLYSDLKSAAAHGMTLVNGLHHLLSADPAICKLIEGSGGSIIDIRKPKPTRDLRFWTGEVYSVQARRVAVLGTDCAIGKRTTCLLLRDELRAFGINTQMIFTGQTGWLQGLDYGFIFDATLNDFVSGELEAALLACEAGSHPDIILMEGQSGLRNPSGPAGSELILSGAAHGVILQHAPNRQFYEGFESTGCRIPSLEDEIALVRILGADVWGISLFTRGMTRRQALRAQKDLSASLGLPVAIPLEDGVTLIAQTIAARCRHGHTAS